MFRLDLLGGHLNINTYVSLLVGNLQELDSAGVRAVARGLPQLGLWSSDHSGNLARVLRATTARNQLLQPVRDGEAVVRRSRHDCTDVDRAATRCCPASRIGSQTLAVRRECGLRQGQRVHWQLHVLRARFVLF